MKSIKILCLLVIFVLAGPVAAGGPPTGTPSPFGDIQSQLDELAAQVQALQEQAPDSSIEGRTYCFVLNLTLMLGRASNGTEELQRNVIRRTATFSGGTFTASLLSNVFNKQQDDGVVITGAGDPIDPLLGTYTQTGNKIDIMFNLGTSANWYVSKDGSVIHGTAISHRTIPPGVVTVGFVREWILVENDTCDMEDQ